jgi:hypothetical protein
VEEDFTGAGIVDKYDVGAAEGGGPGGNDDVPRKYASVPAVALSISNWNKSANQTHFILLMIRAAANHILAAALISKIYGVYIHRTPYITHIYGLAEIVQKRKLLKS